MTKLKRVSAILVVAAALLVAAACAPSYAHLNDSAHGGDNTVFDFTGQHLSAPAAEAPGNIAQIFDTSNHRTRNYHGSTWLDARTGGADGNSRTAVEVVGTGIQNGTQGGTISYYNASTNWDDWHYRNGIKIDQAQWVTDTMKIVNEGDAVKFQAGSEDSRFSRSWVDYAHDDCVQADYGKSAVIEQSLLFDCYNGLSARPSDPIDASGHELYVDHSIVEVSDHDSCYHPADYGCPNHAGWLKWSGDTATDLGFAANTSTFGALSYPEIGDLELNARIVTNVDGNAVTNAQACHDVTLDFMGPSTEVAAFLHDATDLTNPNSWKSKCPTGLVVNTGSAASVHFLQTVQAWHDAHDADLG